MSVRYVYLDEKDEHDNYIKMICEHDPYSFIKDYNVSLYGEKKLITLLEDFDTEEEALGYMDDLLDSELYDRLVYYHVSDNLEHDGCFEPRIPNKRLEDEDRDTERICVSKFIGGCLTSMPNGGSKFDIINIKPEIIQNVEDTTTGDIDNNELRKWKLFKIYPDKYNINPNKDIFNWELLYKCEMVKDAYHTEECWITQNIEVGIEDIDIIKITNWEQSSRDLVESTIQYEAIESDGDLERVFNEYYPDKNIPCMTLIHDVLYEKVEE